eukprot:TRINITY_DN51285_c0_g1_i1.p1 TRINITY_DN51285_c0_g1~~TRINITY_DN51285_c0_g1_i1.p1  ORF type:complete len:374 (-),score=58.50 TRINITY_DN51285_c0_g1_i1:371-1492(-)
MFSRWAAAGQLALVLAVAGDSSSSLAGGGLRAALQLVGLGEREAPCEYEVRWQRVKGWHQTIDTYLARTLCRLDEGVYCRTGRDRRPYQDGRSSFPGSDGEWAISGHTGESETSTRFLFDVAFLQAPRRVCEVGFNVGHSAVTLLVAAGANASYLGFDMSVLNPGVNEEFFEMLKRWLGAERDMEMHWGDAEEQLDAYLSEPLAAGSEKACDLIFYDGRHDFLAVLPMIVLLRRLASGRRPLLVVDEVRCGHRLCGHGSWAWDFFIWLGALEEIACRSSASRTAAAAAYRDALDGSSGEEHLDFGLCVGELLRGPRFNARKRCGVFDAACVARSYREDYPAGYGEEVWPRCCLDHFLGDLAQSLPAGVVPVGL